MDYKDYIRVCIRIVGYILGLCRDNGKENGTYYIIIEYIGDRTGPHYMSVRWISRPVMVT